MKKILLLFTIFQIMLISVIAQNSTEKIENLKQTNQLVIDKYKEGKLKDATKAAGSALELTIEIFGEEHKETAVSYNNLGAIYKARKKYSKASEYLRKSLEIYQLNPKKNESEIAKTLESLGVVLTLDGKTKEAEEVIENSITGAEKAFGGESKELMPYIKTATYFYSIAGKYERVEELFARRYNIARKVYGKESEEPGKIGDEFFCYTKKFSPQKQEEKQQKFYDLTGGDVMPNSVLQGKLIDAGIVNGKAIFLPPPVYPLSARRRDARGSVSIRVIINENGDVTSSKSVCEADQNLRESCEEAALKAKFKPTLLNGEPVKVSGMITYVFN